MIELQAIPHKDQSRIPDKLILVVVDERDFGATVLQTIQERTPYKAIRASNGPQALKIIAHLTCDLFLLDAHLPHMNGFKLFDQLHATTGYEETPAIFLCTSPLRSQLARQQRPPGVSQPIALEHLLHTLQQILEPEDSSVHLASGRKPLPDEQGKETLPCHTKKKEASSSVLLMKKCTGLLLRYMLSMWLRLAPPSVPPASKPANIQQIIKVFTIALRGTSGSNGLGCAANGRIISRSSHV